MEAQKDTFIHPDVAKNLEPKITSLPAEDISLGDDFELRKMRRALGLRKAINESAEELATHPLIVIKELRLAQTDNALKAREIEEKRIARYGYVGDIHGLSDSDFAKLRETLVRENFDQIFFMGDIGGSEKLAKLQKLFYHGDTDTRNSQMKNRYEALVKEGKTDDATLLEELKSGYLNLAAYERVLAQKGLTEEEARAQVEKLNDEQILEGIRWTVKHVHYGHYASDLSNEIKANLAQDVEGYYTRFAHMVAELRLHTKAKVYTIQGNWDARLPIDFRPNTAQAEPLPISERVFNITQFFRDSGIEYSTNINTVDDRQSLHVLVPFDPLVAQVPKEKIEALKKQIKAARKNRQTVILVTHAVPAWIEAHGKPQKLGGEGDLSEKGLRALLAGIDPDEIVYGHEHFIRKDEQGNSLLNSKYRIISRRRKTIIGGNETVTELGKKQGGVIATHIPIPGEPFSGVATVEIPKLARNKSPRGRGGLREPVRVGGNAVPQRRINQELPTGIDVLYPQIDMKKYVKVPDSGIDEK